MTDNLTDWGACVEGPEADTEAEAAGPGWADSEWDEVREVPLDTPDGSPHPLPWYADVEDVSRPGARSRWTDVRLRNVSELDEDEDYRYGDLVVLLPDIAEDTPWARKPYYETFEEAGVVGLAVERVWHDDFGW